MAELNIKYGFCNGECSRWVPRDEMLSINVCVYDKDNNESKIPLRYCPDCWREMVDYLSSMRWDNNLKTAAEIKSDEKLSSQSDLEYDDSINVVIAAKIAKSRENKRFKCNNNYFNINNDDNDNNYYKKCESEAEFRKAGSQIDVKY